MNFQKIKELQEQCYTTSEANGWHDGLITIERARVLIATELMEAVEAIREHQPAWYKENNKPCGWLSECIDTIIRIFDHSKELELELEFNEPANATSSAPHQIEFYDDMLCLLYDYEYSFDICLSKVLMTMIFQLEQQMYDVELAILSKDHYNQSRGYRHGNKSA